MEKCEYRDHECYPSYGVAPHIHDLSGGSFIGSTRLLKKEMWPANFIEDPEAPGCGTYLCPGCCNKSKSAEELSMKKECHKCGDEFEFIEACPTKYCSGCNETLDKEDSK